MTEPPTPMTMRLLMLGPSPAVKGGVSAVEKLILAAMPKHIRVQHIATMEDGTKLVKLRTFIRSLRATWSALRGGVDIVHIHFASRASSVRKELLARIALRAGARVVMHAHGAEYRLYWQEMSERQRRNTLAVLTRIDTLIVLGDRWKEFFVSIGVPAEKIVVLRNPVALPEHVPVRLMRDRVRFAYLGIVDHRKGAFDLVEAIGSLPGAMRDRLELTVAGNGELDRLRRAVEQHGLDAHIAVRDWLQPDERDRLLAESDVFVLPSYNEGLSMALLEAMAWGLLPICTPVGSIPEVVTSGVNGLFVTPGDIPALAAAISRAVTDRDERMRLSAAARATVEPLSIAHYMRELCRLYANVSSGESIGLGSAGRRSWPTVERTRASNS